jgi:phosphoadenosine phosphosulfate reductase
MLLQGSAHGECSIRIRRHYENNFSRRLVISAAQNSRGIYLAMLQTNPQTNDQEQAEEAAADWARRLASASPHAIIEASARALPGRLAAVSSFGTESAVLLKFVAEVDPSLPVLFLDTLWLFKETLAYRDLLVAHLGLTDVRTITPSPSALANRDPRRDLCFLDQDACCNVRKVAPLAKELESFAGWISGRKRYQGGGRAGLAVVEADGRRLKFNPLALLTAAEINAVFADADLPRHPLETAGFRSIGCIPCTSRVLGHAATRDGRWSGLVKTECGIHTRALSAAAPGSLASGPAAPG